MMRALLSGVSGLRNHQTEMDVIGNNIANVNTVGFKASRVTFQEGFVQLLAKATRPNGGMGGTNPLQIGTGSQIGSIDQLFTQGSLENTGQPLDLAIQGDGMFVLSNGERTAYTRAGNFRMDADGRLVSPFTGFVLQGVNADARGNFSPSGPIGTLQISLGTEAPAQQTGGITMTGNLDGSTAVGGTHSMGVTVYDSLGGKHDLQILFTNTGPGAWSWTATCDSAPVTPAGDGTVTFNTDGTLATFTYPGGGTGLTLTPPGADPLNITLDPGTIGGNNGLSGYASASSAVISHQDGFEAGDLISVSVDTNGTVNGSFSNGVTRILGQIALANFTNPAGLIRTGENLYQESPNSGTPSVTTGRGATPATITSGALESSNVDISQEFSDMIIAQRGFQANARVITTADEMLNDLVNLRR
jgi:flagellar hook protein FlgE